MLSKYMHITIGTIVGRPIWYIYDATDTVQNIIRNTSYVISHVYRYNKIQRFIFQNIYFFLLVATAPRFRRLSTNEGNHVAVKYNKPTLVSR